MSKRTYPVPNKNLSGSDYIENKRAKQLFSGTSNLAKTIEEQNGNFPLLTPLGKQKPYQGTYGLSGRSETGNKSYCLNTSRSYRDLLAITKGKYLLTPPNIADDNFIQFKDVSEAQKLYNGLYYVYTYNSNNLIAYMSPAYPTSPASYLENVIEYNTTTSSNQRIIVDPSYVITYSSQSCVFTPSVISNITINNDYESRYSFNRTINLDLLTGFQYPSKFKLEYDSGDCINSNNDIQTKYSFPSFPTNIIPPSISGSTNIGDVLTCSDGTWTGFPFPTLTFQWFRGPIQLPNQTSKTYTIALPTGFPEITCKVTGTNSSGYATATSSNSIIPTQVPNNTAQPVISGDLEVGATLTCSAGSWTAFPVINPSTGYSYQWLRNGSPIGPATNINTYVTTLTDVGKTITCNVTATNSSGSSTATSSNSVTPTSVPIISVAPSITPSTPVQQPVGSTLSCSTGTWIESPAITSYAYQWLRNGSSISGATNNTYTTQSPDDIGKTITCNVTATNSIGSATATSSNSVIISSAPINLVAPSITPMTIIAGSPTPLSCSTGTWIAYPTSPPLTYAYQWLRNSSPILGATNSTYTPQTPADVGQQITCQVTATNSIGSSATSSNIVTPSSVPLISVAPSITPTTIAAGSPTPLSCSTGTWIESPPITSYAYQWLRNSVAIGGATNSNYTTQTPADQNKTITCRVTATNSVGSSAPATSSNSVTPT